jgi:hypothetical protein
MSPIAAQPRMLTTNVPIGNDEVVHDCPIFAMTYRKTAPMDPPRATTRRVVNSITRPAGFEPATFALGKRCSIQLSYERQRGDCIVPHRVRCCVQGAVFNCGWSG